MRRYVWSGIFVCAFMLLIGMTWAFELAFEAEDANVIEAPMVVAAPADAAAEGGAEPSDPSGGKFVWMPGAPASGGGGEGYMEFVFDLPAGTYAIWGRVVAWDGNSDSFWVTWQPADPDENPQDTQNTEYRWAVQQGPDWHWDRINQWLDGGTFDREWTFDTAGTTTLRIWTREDATMLDSIYITDNLSEDEAEVQPKLPSEVSPPTAVEPGNKLTTTWATLKQFR